MTEHEETATPEAPPEAPSQEPIPEFLCGIKVMIPIHGMGLDYQVLEGPEFIRSATITDQAMLAGLFQMHMQAIMAGAQVKGVLSQMANEKQIVRPPKGFRGH
jgi:hypothetical protein